MITDNSTSSLCEVFHGTEQAALSKPARALSRPAGLSEDLASAQLPAEILACHFDTDRGWREMLYLLPSRLICRCSSSRQITYA